MSDNSTLSRLRAAAEFSGVSAKFGGFTREFTITIKYVVNFNPGPTRSELFNYVTSHTHSYNFTEFDTTLTTLNTVYLLTAKGTTTNDYNGIQIANDIKNILKNSPFSITIGAVSGETRVIIEGLQASGGIAAAGSVHTPITSNTAITNNSSTYTVKPGDTLSKISAKTGVNVLELARLNGISNINLILVGQVLRLSGTANANNIPQTIFTPTGNTNTSNNTSIPLVADNRNWFDKNFFTGAGTLSAIGIGAIIVVGAVVISQKR